MDAKRCVENTMTTNVDAAPSIAERLGANAPARRFARLKAWLLWGLLIIAVAVAVALWQTSRASESPQYVTEPATRGNLTVIVSATGTLAPTNQVDVGSELSGIVKTVEIDYDDRVRVGQVLARLDTTKLDAQTNQSKAALEAAQAKLQQTRATDEEARAQLTRLEQVHQASNGRVPSAQELDAQRATVKRAEADQANAAATVAQAKATLDANQTDLSKMVIRSPINGIVLTCSVDPGQTVAASFQAPVLFTIAEDLTKMELEVDVDEADVGQVRAGQEATFTVDAYPDRVFTARLDAVRFASETVSGVVTYKAILRVDNPDLLLRPGMTSTADIIVQKVADALLVPNGALRFIPASETSESSSSNGGFLSRLMPRPPRSSSTVAEVRTDGKQRVWALRNGQAVAVSIVVGTTDGVKTEVREGDLQPNEAVIVDTASGSGG